MSIPACAWASKKGRELRLSCPERVTLWQLAERANFKGFCWPSVVQLMEDTGLARQTVLTVVHGLAALGLIRIEKQGQKHVYHVIRPPEPVYNKTGQRSKNRPDGQSKSRPVDSPSTGLNSSSDRSKKTTGTGLKSLPGTLKEPKKEPSARVTAREPEKQDLSFGKQQEGAAPPPAASIPAPAPAAPDIAATPGRDTFNAYLDDPNPERAIPAEIEQDVIRADLPDPDAPVDPEYVRAVVAELRHEWRMRAYPPRATDLSRSEQSDLCQVKPSIRSAHLPDAVLRLQRRQAGIRHAADA